MKHNSQYNPLDSTSQPWYLKDVVGIEIGPTGAAVADTVYMSEFYGKDAVLKDEVSLFKEYVKQGGNLFVIGAPGVYNSYGQIQKETSIGDLIGASFNEIVESDKNTYIRFDSSVKKEFIPIMEGVRQDWELFVEGEFYKLSPTTAQSFGELCIGHRSEKKPDDMDSGAAALAVWNQLMSAGKALGPAILKNCYGKGTVITVPCHIDRAYSGNYRMPEHRKLISNIVRMLNPSPEVIVKTSLNTEIIITRNSANGDILIHFLTFNGTIPSTDAGHLGTGKKVCPPLMEEAALYNAEITVNFSFSEAKSIDGTPLMIKNDIIVFTSSKVHELIIVSFKIRQKNE